MHTHNGTDTTQVNQYGPQSGESEDPPWFQKCPANVTHYNSNLIYFFNITKFNNLMMYTHRIWRALHK